MPQPNPDKDEIAALFTPPVRVIETHISRLFLTGDRAFKLKKAVQLPYVDFSTVARRHDACEAELALNRRTAASLYLGCRALCRENGDVLHLDGPGDVVDWLVEMRRFDTEQTFDRLLARKALTSALAEAAADTIAAFHAVAEMVQRDAWISLSRVLDLNEAAFAGRAAGSLPEDALGDLMGSQRAALSALRPQLQHRQALARMRRCHGDLHLGNIVVIDDAPVLFDCLEFDSEMAEIDTLYDMAFLLMDLVLAERSDLANAALNRYLEATGDDGGMALLPLYVSVRAAIRCHIAALTAEGADRAQHYLALGRAALETTAPRLIAIGGLSGTGKTTLARRLAPPLGQPCGAVILRSDTIRKRLHGIAMEERLPPESYTPESSRQVYAAMQARAGTLLAAGATVIMDAVFGRPEECEMAEAVARAAGCRFDGVWLTAPEAVLTQRVTSRQNDASDATADVVRWQSRNMQAAQGWHIVQAGAACDDSLRQAQTMLERE